jgi:hypothetical protein
VALVHPDNPLILAAAAAGGAGAAVALLTLEGGSDCVVRALAAPGVPPGRACQIMLTTS